VNLRIGNNSGPRIYRSFRIVVLRTVGGLRFPLPEGWQEDCPFVRTAASEAGQFSRDVSLYSNSSTQNLTSSVTWTSTTSGVATITSAGLATGVAPGNTTIQTTAASINAYGNLERLSDERNSGTNIRQIRVSPADAAVAGISDDTWYWCTVKGVEGGISYFSVYDASLNLVVTTTFTATSGFPAQMIYLGNRSATASESGETTYFDDPIVDYANANFPLLPKKSGPRTQPVTPAQELVGPQ